MKKDLARLALLGMSASFLVGGCQKQGGSGGNSATAAEEQPSQDTQSFLDSLSPDAQQKFNSLDSKHQKMAMDMTQQDCSGKNECKGLGGCRSAEHACAGMNDCKGKGGGAPIKDPNKAVEIQYKNQTNQRTQMSGSMGGTQGSPQSGSTNSSMNTRQSGYSK